jgi:hypothetical protein
MASKAAFSEVLSRLLKVFKKELYSEQEAAGPAGSTALRR